MSDAESRSRVMRFIDDLLGLLHRRGEPNLRPADLDVAAERFSLSELINERKVLGCVEDLSDLQEVLGYFYARLGGRELGNHLGSKTRGKAVLQLELLTIQPDGTTSATPSQLCWMMMLGGKRFLTRLIHTLTGDEQFRLNWAGFAKLLQHLSQPLQQIDLFNHGNPRGNFLVGSLLAEIHNVGRRDRCRLEMERIGEIVAELIGSGHISPPAAAFVINRLLSDLNATDLTSMPFDGNNDGRNRWRAEIPFATMTILKIIFANGPANIIWGTAGVAPLTVCWAAFRYFRLASEAVGDVKLKSCRTQAFLIQDFSVELIEAVADAVWSSNATVSWEKLNNFVNEVRMVEAFPLFATQLFADMVGAERFPLVKCQSVSINRCLREILNFNVEQFADIDCGHNDTDIFCVVKSLIQCEVVSDRIVPNLITAKICSAVSWDCLGSWEFVSSYLVETVREYVLPNRWSVWESAVFLIRSLITVVTPSVEDQMVDMAPTRLFGLAIVSLLGDVRMEVDLSSFRLIRNWIRLVEETGIGSRGLEDMRNLAGAMRDQIVSKIGTNSSLNVRRELTILLQLRQGN